MAVVWVWIGLLLEVFLVVYGFCVSWLPLIVLFALDALGGVVLWLLIVCEAKSGSH